MIMVGTAPFEWLYDGLPEDGIQEFASLRIDLADTPEEAAAKMTALIDRDEAGVDSYGTGAYFNATQREWRRAMIGLWDEDGNELGELYGYDAERHAGLQDRLDELFYVRCGANDEGAREWWRCELVIP